jgi:DNA mismatch endonuclease, patch repair protein
MRVPRPPPPSSTAVTAIMKANKARDTGPELALRRALRARGARGYRLSPKEIPGRPDITFTREKFAVFVHGCFWHRHRCEKASRELPRTNRVYWKTKFRLNVERDERKTRILESRGWRVLTVWECEIDEDADAVARRVVVERSLNGISIQSRNQRRVAPDV